jgi:hypothetical protein
MEDREKEQMTYEPPTVIDYGTLLEVTQASNFQNRDNPTGTNNTAYSPAP